MQGHPQRAETEQGQEETRPEEPRLHIGPLLLGAHLHRPIYTLGLPESDMPLIDVTFRIGGEGLVTSPVISLP
jgi:hypothetical protein